MSVTPIDDYRNIRSDEEGMEQSYIREERKIIIHRALKNLKSEYHQVLYLIYFEGFDNKQAAAVMKRAAVRLKTLFIAQKYR